MATEEHLVRPYRGVELLDTALQSLIVYFGREVALAGRATTVAAERFDQDPVLLQLASSAERLDSFVTDLEHGLNALDLVPDDICLIAVASTPTLKIAEVVWMHELRDTAGLPHVVDLTAVHSRPRPFNAIHSGCVLDVYLCLAQEQPRHPLRPWRKGTWLARATFTIGTDLAAIGLTTVALTDLERERLMLPAGAFRFIEIEDVLDPEAASGLILYLDETLLAALSHDPRSRGAKALQRQLFVDTMTAVIIEAAVDPRLPDLTVDQLEGSLLGHVLSRLCGGHSADEEHATEVMTMMEELRTAPLRVVSRVEHCVGELLGDYVALVAGAP